MNQEEAKKTSEHTQTSRPLKLKITYILKFKGQTYHWNWAPEQTTGKWSRTPKNITVGACNPWTAPKQTQFLEDTILFSESLSCAGPWKSPPRARAMLKTSLLTQVFKATASAQAGSPEDHVTLMNSGEEDITEKPRHHCFSVCFWWGC